jgi:hypothetical protein
MIACELIKDGQEGKEVVMGASVGGQTSQLELPIHCYVRKVMDPL